MKIAKSLLLAAVTLSTACGGALNRADLFSSDWSADRAQGVDAVRSRLAGTRPSPGTDIAIGVAGNGDKIVAVLLDSGEKWTYAHPLDARPAIAGQVVVGSGGGEVFALDARSGKKLWARPTGGLPLIGAGDDGQYTVITFGRSGGARGSTLLAIERDGNVRRQIETDKEVGVPAVVGGLAFIPWGRQYVSVFDVVAADEPARILFREQVSRAWTQGGSVYFGENSVYRFDERIKDASLQKASHVMLPPRELPGSPVLMPPIEERPKLVASARDRVRTYVRPTTNVQTTAATSDKGSAPEQGWLVVANSRYYATYFRIIMGFDASRGGLSWVYTHPTEVIGGAAGEDGFLICDEQGKVVFLSANQGDPLGERDLGEPVKSCVVQVDALAVRGGKPARPVALAEELAEALRVPDPELATGKRLLVREIASLEDEVATKALIDVMNDPAISPFVASDVRTALAARRKGGRYMLAALERRYDYLHNVLKPPPVGPIAQSFAAMNDPSAAPLLSSHLLDPVTPDQDLQETAAALTTLAGPAEVPTVKQFFVLNYASAATAPVKAAVVSAGQILLKHGGKDGRALVDRAIASKLTAPDVRAKLKELYEVVR
ncbi:PQQ-binding-like beta-propeller repeat protein [Pendulispora rubella]|uniref:PQQ-binding-like beta-propeller repeat protein n=1 Tax=Pendulispora rubella TaxID=2741070 RepID=A0ABZ2KYC9_9BACT